MKTLNIAAFAEYLRNAEKSAATIEKYTREARKFAAALGSATLTKEAVIDYKARLVGSGRKVAGINAVIAALNSYLEFTGLGDCKVKPLKIQRKQFRDATTELTREEYDKLVNCANRRLRLIMQTICSMGLRVSELRCVTTEALRSGKVTVTNKGKTRLVPIPLRLREKLGRYVAQRNMPSGILFTLTRQAIWYEMKKLCEKAGVASGKVFPHNLRHLFAVTFYAMERDIVKLADILGHSNVNTTRIYTLESNHTYFKVLDKLELVN